LIDFLFVFYRFSSGNFFFYLSKADAYENCFKALRAEAPGWRPKHFMTDFEAAYEIALRKVFPLAHVYVLSFNECILL
jgi:hypothetical protein